VLVTYDGIVKVVDFGIAKATWQASRTRPGVVKGKYAYMSPEQVEGRSLDARSDIFSVGICLYEVMTGMPLYRRDNVTEAMKEIRDGKPIHPEHHRPDVPHELIAVLKKALATSRDDRYPTAAAMQLDLERYLKAASGLATPQVLGDYLKAEAPRPPEGEILSEPKNLVVDLIEPRPSAGVVKGGTAPLSQMSKPGVAPAYESMRIEHGPSSQSSREKLISNETPNPADASVTTPGKHMRAAPHTPLPERVSTSERRPVVPAAGFDDDLEDLTRQDAPPSMTAAEEQATTRAPKLTPPAGELEIRLPTGERAATRSSPGERADRSGRSGPLGRASRSGNSGPLPANPLGNEISDPARDGLHSEQTAMTDSALGPKPKRRVWPLALLSLLLVAGGGLFVFRDRLPFRIPGVPTSNPVKPVVVVPPMVLADLATTPADLATVAKEALDAGATPQVVTVELPVQTSATLGINTRPSGAKIFLDGEQLDMLTPVRSQPITAGPHHLVIERTGYQPREIDITLKSSEHRVLDFELTEDRPLQDHSTPNVNNPQAGHKNHPPVGMRGNGFLTAKTEPWSRAYEGSRLLGETPLVNVPLTDGPHVITFVNPDYTPIKKKVSIKVGEETKIIVTFEK
jgi:serine/threonine protein kinase